MTSDDKPPSSWDVRYSEDHYRYGTDPNDFLREQADRIPEDSRVLCLAEGEGRNAVFLAERGHRPVAVDQSSVGLEKTRRLAQERGVVVETVTADLEGLRVEPEGWDAIVSIWCHLAPEPRKDLHRRVVAGLKPGGILILEAYTPDQLDRGTGGPPHPERLMRLEEIREELAGLEFQVAREVERDVQEGDLHTGVSSVLQIVARRPQPGIPE